MFEDRYSLAFKLYPYERSADQDAETTVRHPVVVMGGGPIGVIASSVIAAPFVGTRAAHVKGIFHLMVDVPSAGVMKGN